MLKQEKASALFVVIIVLIVIAIIATGTFFILNSDSDNSNTANTNTNSNSKPSVLSKSIKSEVVTAENYTEISNKIGEDLKGTDEPYQFLYACMYYVMTDGMSSVLDPNADENTSYARVYGKTVQQLINEGKQLMIDNNTTVEQFKQSMESSANDYNI